MYSVESIPALRETVNGWRKAGASLAFVPTMGNLHAGHLRLVQAAKPLADRVVVSIFVNPTQFSQGEDFGAYPRTPGQDAEMLRKEGVDLLFMPAKDEIYPAGSVTVIEVAGISDDLCGQFRPGHFRGVATVVCKLFNMVQPDVALFGEKDWQQLTVIRRMVADLNLPVRVVGVPTMRESSGLAMSSRNGYLSAEETRKAAALYRSLMRARSALEAGQRDYTAIEADSLALLQGEGFKTDYFAVRKAEDLSLPSRHDRDWVVLVAAWLGRARLIDNIRVSL